MSGNDKVIPAATAEVVCEDGLCSVARPLGGAALPSRKLGIAAGERPGASLHPLPPQSSAPTKRPFLVDLLHGDVDLERFFKDE